MALAKWKAVVERNVRAIFQMIDRLDAESESFNVHTVDRHNLTASQYVSEMTENVIVKCCRYIIEFPDACISVTLHRESDHIFVQMFPNDKPPPLSTPTIDAKDLDTRIELFWKKYADECECDRLVGAFVNSHYVHVLNDQPSRSAIYFIQQIWGAQYVMLANGKQNFLFVANTDCFDELPIAIHFPPHWKTQIYAYLEMCILPDLVGICMSYLTFRWRDPCLEDLSKP